MKTMTNNSRLVNAKKMLALANEFGFAIPHININNLEWIQAVLSASEQAQSPVILGVSEGAAKYMGSYKIIVDMVNQTIISQNITIPVCLHLDHGGYQACLQAIEAGFTSIMYDGSHDSFSENLKNSKELVKLCKDHELSIEVEVGTIGGYEDGKSTNGEFADINECIEISKLDIDFLAAGIGNIHGVYPKDWKGLNFALLQEIVQKTNKGFVLHGGSGISNEMIREAIKLGVRKINVNTECQIAFSNAIKEYFIEHPDLVASHSYDPRKYLKLGKQAIIDTCIDKMSLFGSKDKVKN